MEETQIKKLPCIMTQSEVLLKSQELTKALDARTSLELEKKDFADQYKERMKEVERRIADLALEVKTGKEQRPIECTERCRYDKRMVDLVRLDTGEVVSSRPMTPSELQLAIEDMHTTAEH